MRKIIFNDFYSPKTPTKIWKFFAGSVCAHFWIIVIVLSIPIAAVIRDTPRVNSQPRRTPSQFSDVQAVGQGGDGQPQVPVRIEPSSVPEHDPMGLNELYTGVSDEYREGDNIQMAPDLSKIPVDLTQPRETTTLNRANRTAPANSTANSTADMMARASASVPSTPGEGQPPVAAGGVQPVPAMQYSYRTRGNAAGLDSDDYIKMYNKRFQSPLQKPDSIFSLKVGTMSYPRIRRALKRRELPPPDTVKIEEMINYFSYKYPQPTGEHPISITTELNACPWAPSHRLLHIGLQSKTVFGDGIKDSMYTVAKDVKIKVNFDPQSVKAYRLIGYANRRPKLLAVKQVSHLSGDLTAGQSVTSLYEIILNEPESNTKTDSAVPAVSLKDTDDTGKRQVACINVTYKQPYGAENKRVSGEVFCENVEENTASENFKFAAAVAQFGILLQEPEKHSLATYKQILEMALEAVGEDRYGHRTQFIKLIEKAIVLVEEKQKATTATQKKP